MIIHPLFAQETPTWQSTVAVLSMCVTGLGVLISLGVLYYMKSQSDSFNTQTQLMREQIEASKKTILEPQPLAVRVMEELQDQFASKTEFINFRTESQKETAALREIIRVELPEMERRIGAAGDARIRRVHQRIEPLVTGVAALCAKQGVTFNSGRVDD